jgi:DNA topoisomerase IB
MFFVPEGEEAEATRLLSSWGKGSFPNLAESILYHLSEHGEEVGAKNALSYLRKAEGFASNLKRARRVALEDGAVRFEKNGRFLIKDAEGLILSFGKLRDPI